MYNERDEKSTTREASRDEAPKGRGRKPKGKGKGNSSKTRTSKYDGRGKHYGNNGNSDATSTTNNDRVASGANDITWYTRNPDQVKSAANISFMNSLGVNTCEFNAGAMIHGNQACSVAPFSAAGVMRVGYIPTFGNPQDPHDAMNIAVSSIFEQVRHANSGKTNYEKADYFKYIVMCDMIYSYAAFLIRVYGIINSYSAVNKFWPETFFEAMGIDINDIRSHIAEFRLFIQWYISKANTIFVPNVFPIFKRHFWMNANIYKDGESLWSQTYMFVPEVYARLNITTGDIDFKMIKDVELTDAVTQLTVARMMLIGTSMLDDYYESSSMAIMSGDSAKAFGDGARFLIDGLNERYVLYPVYDSGVVNQFMNSTACGWLADVNGLSVKLADTVAYSLHEVTNGIGLAGYPNGYLQLGTYNSGSGNYVPIKMIQAYVPDPAGLGDVDVEDLLNAKKYGINLTIENPTPEDIIESTRTRATGFYNYDAVQQILNFILSGCGADVFTTYKIFYMKESSGQLQLQANQPFTNLIFCDPTDMTYYNTLLSDVILLGDFDWHPIVNVITYDTSNSYAFHQPYVDKYRYALVAKDVLDNIHAVANLSLFNVQQ